MTGSPLHGKTAEQKRAIARDDFPRDNGIEHGHAFSLDGHVAVLRSRRFVLLAPRFFRRQRCRWDMPSTRHSGPSSRFGLAKSGSGACAAARSLLIDRRGISVAMVFGQRGLPDFFAHGAYKGLSRVEENPAQILRTFEQAFWSMGGETLNSVVESAPWSLGSS